MKLRRFKRRLLERAFLSVGGAIAVGCVTIVACIGLLWLVWEVIDFLNRHFPPCQQNPQPTNIVKFIPSQKLTTEILLAGVGKVTVPATATPSVAVMKKDYLVSRSDDLVTWKPALVKNCSVDDIQRVVKSLAIGESAVRPTNSCGFYRYSELANGQSPVTE